MPDFALKFIDGTPVPDDYAAKARRLHPLHPGLQHHRRRRTHDGRLLATALATDTQEQTP